MEEVIVRALLYLNINPSLNGFNYLKRAIALALTDHAYLVNIRKTYFIIAKENNVTSSSVERSIRYAITRAFDSGKEDAMIKCFGGLIDSTTGTISNKTFITDLSIKIRSYLEENNEN